MQNSIKRVAALSRIIFIDGMRRHALIGLLVLALAAEAGGLVFFDFIPRDIGRASNDFIFSVSWIAGFIFLFFHAVQVMAWDEERRVIHLLLARPLSRQEYVVGVFAGLGALLLLLNLTLGIIGWATLMIIKRTVAIGYFSYFSHGFYVQCWLGLSAMELMVLSAIMLFSGLIRGSFPVLLVSLCYYMICSGIPVVCEIVAQRMRESAGSVIYKFLQVMTAVFPDFSRLDFKDAVVSSLNPPQLTHTLTAFGVVVTYTVLALFLSGTVYKRRDLQ
jgi:Cu-processing system permease protein